MILTEKQLKNFRVLLNVYEEHFMREFTKAELLGDDVKMDLLKIEKKQMHELHCEIAPMFCDCIPDSEFKD